MHIARQHPAHLLRLEMVVIVREEQPSLLLVADKAIDLLQKVPALHGDAHVGNGRIHFFAVLFGVFQGLLDRLLFKVQLQRDAVAVGKDLIPLLGQQVDERRGIRPLGDGGSHITPVVKDGQPGAHAVRYLFDEPGVDFVVFQLVNDILPHAAVIDKAHEGGPELHVGDILCHVAAHAAVNLLHSARVAPAGDIGRKRISLDVHKHCADDYDAHKFLDSFPDFTLISPII